MQTHCSLFARVYVCCCILAAETDINREGSVSCDDHRRRPVRDGVARLLDGHRPAARLLDWHVFAFGVDAASLARRARVWPWHHRQRARGELCILCATLPVPYFHTHTHTHLGLDCTIAVTEACARRPGAAASVSCRRRERRILLAGGGRRASRSHTLAAIQAFECMHMFVARGATTFGHACTTVCLS